MTGSTDTRLATLRGNSASGKSTIAAILRGTIGPGLAVVEQDHVRRIILQERDNPDSANIGLIATMARFCLDSGFDVLIEGILDSDRYGPMLSDMTDDHRGVTRHFYLDVDIEETCRRHAGREKAAHFDVERMRSWYRPHDLLGGLTQTLISGEAPAAEAADQIVRHLGLAETSRRRPATAI